MRYCDCNWKLETSSFHLLIISVLDIHTFFKRIPTQQLDLNSLSKQWQPYMTFTGVCPSLPTLYSNSVIVNESNEFDGEILSVFSRQSFSAKAVSS